MREHVIDRLADWGALVGTAAVVLFLWLGREHLARLAADGDRRCHGSSRAGQALANEITGKLESLSQGTQAFADSMQDVAAANTLVQAADGVLGTANRFRTRG